MAQIENLNAHELSRLADGSSYHFLYESAVSGTVTGRISQVTYPNGGVVNYTYGPVIGKAGGYCNYYTAYCYNGDGTPSSLTRTDVSGTTTYTRTPTTGVTTVVGPAPANNRTAYQFTQAIPTDTPPPGQYDSQTPWFLARTTWKQGNGTVLKLSVMCYNGVGASSAAACSTAPFSTPPTYPIKQVDIYTEFGPSGWNRTTKTYDAYQNVTGETYYDYGATVPTRQHLMYNYGYSWNGSACVLIANSVWGVNNVPCQEQLQNGAGVPIENTYYTYDTKGNLISKSVWASGSISGGSYLTKSYVYNSNGTVSTITDENQNLTSLSYGSCNEGMPTQVTVWPVPTVTSLSENLQWDSGCKGAVITSITDPNGNPSSATYNDPLWRPTSSTDESGSTVNFSYTPTTLESQMSFNGGSSDFDTFDTSDSLGRPLYTQVIEGPGGVWDTKQSGFTWDSTGIVTSVTLPCASTKGSGCSTPATTSTHDALDRPLVETDGGGGTTTYSYLGRDVLVTIGPQVTQPATENLKQRQMEYDGLGRLTSVCEVTSATGSGAGSCGQPNSETGLLTKYTYDAADNLLTVKQNAQPGAIGGTQTRTFAYDNLNRLISETNPEWGPGITTYTYDSDSTGGCPGTYKGDLVKRVDSAGNVTCYTYDGVQRMLSTTYTGPNAITNRYFVWDAAIVAGATMQNAKGRMAEAYTATCPTCSKVTDEGFSYDVRGELSAFYESTPNSGGYYNIPMTYWANGLMQTFGPFLTEPKYQVTPDGKGRPYAISNGGSNAASIAYNTASGQPVGDQPTQIMTSCAGSTCYPITYQYDPNTLRMTNYSATMNNETVSGALTWNPNGSLQQLVVTDPLNSADAQACTYSADDLRRAASVNCMNGTTNVWAQNFTYDAFGNITKQVPSGGTGISWMPGYTTSTNRYSLGGTSYDADGNILNDTFNKYTWDAEGKPLTTAYSEGSGQTWSFVYDAFGHKVESEVNGAYENSYVTFGNFKLSATAQTAYYSEYPFPGGSFASEDGGATGLQLGDWLGTVRAFVSSTGGTISQTGAHAPFGESYAYNQGYPRNFTGQQNDSNMANTTYYFPDRQYRSSQGRWLSPDPAGLDAVDSGNPQSWNRYAYVGNSPLSSTDPTGRLTIVIPGTWADNANDWTADKPLVQEMSRIFHEDAAILSWSFANSDQARRSAAQYLRNIVNNYQFKPGEKLNIITSSHGGNVALLATNGLTHPIDNLISLGVPLRRDYTPDLGEIRHWLNVFTVTDRAQQAGEWGGGPLGRVAPGAMNYGVHTNIGPIGSHVALWNDATVRNQWESFFQSWSSWWPSPSGGNSNPQSDNSNQGGTNPNPPAPAYGPAGWPSIWDLF